MAGFVRRRLGRFVGTHDAGWGVALGLLAYFLAASPAFPEDVRVEKANGLLSESETWPEAIRIFREILAAEPERLEVRRSLAQVLSWGGQYTDAIAEFELVLLENPHDLDVRLDRADALSWSSHYAEAEAEFKAVLGLVPLSSVKQPDPRTARAARGLAYVYLWSDRRAEADAAFGRALALDEHEQARSDWEDLRAQLELERREQARTLRQEEDTAGTGDQASWRSGKLELLSGFLNDSGRFSRYESFVHGSVSATEKTRVFGHAGFVKVRHRAVRPEFYPELPRLTERDRARDVAIGVERQLSEDLKASVEVGQRSWKYADDRVYVRGHLELALSPTVALLFRLSREGHLDHSDSREALAANLRGNYGSLGIWSALTPRVELFAQVQGGWLSDDNRFRSGYLDLSFRPFSDRDTQIGFRLNTISYAFRSNVYYAPNLDAGGVLVARKTFGLLRRFTGRHRVFLEVEGVLGYGFTRTAAIRGSGVAWGYSAAVEWRGEPWAFRVVGHWSVSQRGSRYSAARVSLKLSRSF